MLMGAQYKRMLICDTNYKALGDKKCKVFVCYSSETTVCSKEMLYVSTMVIANKILIEYIQRKWEREQHISPWKSKWNIKEDNKRGKEGQKKPNQNQTTKN